MSIDTVSDLTPRVQYVAAAAQVAFDYPFPIFSDADLVVDVDGVTQTLTDDYTVTGEGDDTGGTVTFVSAMAGDEVVTIYRDMVLERSSDFPVNGAFSSSSFNDEFDRITLVHQDLAQQIRRCLRLPMTAEATDAEAELAPIANWLSKYVYISAAGVPEPAAGVSSVTLTQSVIGATLIPQSAAEVLAGITPAYYQYQPCDVRRYGADITGVLSSKTALESAIAVASAQTYGGTVHIPAGLYVWTGAITVPGNVSIRGEGVGTQLRPATDGFILLHNDTIGGKRIENFFMQCTAGSPTGHIGIDCVPSTTFGEKLFGVAFRDILILNFETGIYAKDVCHSVFDHVYVYGCKYGIQFIGQCISTDVVSSKIVRGVSLSSDGSRGIFVDHYTYSDAVARRPEAIRISNETLVFGFDENVYVFRCLVFSATNCDIDYSVNYGFRISDVTGGCTIADNWIAGTNDADGTPKLIAIDDFATPNSAPVLIDNNYLNCSGTEKDNTYAIRLGQYRVACRVTNNVVVANCVQYALYIDGDGSLQHYIERNTLNGITHSLWQVAGYGHSFVRNIFNGPINRTSLTSNPDVFDHNTGTAATGCHIGVTVPSGAGPASYSAVTLGMAAAPVTASPGNLRMRVNAYQFAGTSTRGKVRGYWNSGTERVVVEWETALGADSGDTWIDMEPY
jgi:hypothetical protein